MPTATMQARLTKNHGRELPTDFMVFKKKIVNGSRLVHNRSKMLGLLYFHSHAAENIFNTLIR